MQGNTRKIIIGFFTLILLVILLIFIFKGFKSTKDKCDVFSGGGYDLLFETNGGKKVTFLDVCIGCPPDAYDTIPTTTRAGYKFAGWYYDKALTKKVEVTNTMDIPTKNKYDERGCHIGYQDITLYAKWDK